MNGKTFGAGISGDGSIMGTGGHKDYSSKLLELTPLEQCGQILFKRDDLFRPFEMKTLNGGKLRQVMTVLRDCRSPGVITAASIHSPQIPLVAGAAYYLGLPCVAVVGGRTMTKELRIANELGADIRRVVSGRHRALYAEVSRINVGLGYHVIPYGIAPATRLREFFITQSKQVENLPDELDALVVTCGSGVSAAAILVGLWRFSKSVSTLILVATGPSRLKRMSQFLQSVSPDAKKFLDSTEVRCVDLFREPRFRYEQRVSFEFCGVELHPRYEAKAFRHIVEKTNYICGRTLFWVIGGDLCENHQLRGNIP